MANKTLNENINQAINDFKGVKQAIIEKGVEIPSGTPTSEYGAKISEIQSGGSGGLDTSGVTSFNNLCRENRFNDQLEKIDTSQGTTFTGMFNYCSSLTAVPQFDTSKGTNFSGMFFECTSLKAVPPLDTSNGTEFQNMFNTCKSLITIELTSFVSSQYMFANCLALENLTVTGTITVNNNYLKLSDSTLLTVDSLLSVLNALADNTGKTKRTITLGATNLAKLTDEQKAIATNKNYTLA